MLEFIGYDFFSGINAMNVVPTNVNNINNTKISNAIFDHFNISSDTTLYGNKEIPVDWTYETKLNANFNDNIDAGNIESFAKQISSIRIKRRIKPKPKDIYDTEYTTEQWVTLKEIKVNNVDDLQFAFNDFLNAYGVRYEYAIVPVIGGTEGDYIMNYIDSKFSGVFIGDAYQSFRFLYDVSYSSNARNQKIGVFAPLGRQYPIIVGNGISSYESGSVTASILNDSFEKDGKINRNDIVEKVNVLKDFLTNKKPKILKDWNGNIYLIIVTDNVQIGYKQGSGMGVPQVQFNWTEIGDANGQEDLYNSGLIGENL